MIHKYRGVEQPKVLQLSAANTEPLKIGVLKPYRELALTMIFTKSRRVVSRNAEHWRFELLAPFSNMRQVKIWPWRFELLAPFSNMRQVKIWPLEGQYSTFHFHYVSIFRLLCLCCLLFPFSLLFLFLLPILLLLFLHHHPAQCQAMPSKKKQGAKFPSSVRRKHNKLQNTKIYM